jgi:hypothetical protein
MTESQENLCVTVVEPVPGAEPELGGFTEMDQSPRATGLGGVRGSPRWRLAGTGSLAGIVRVVSYYRSTVEDWTWQPVLGGTVALHREVAGFGAQLTIGKQRDPLRAYSDQGELLAESSRWSWFFELAGSADLR